MNYVQSIKRRRLQKSAIEALKRGIERDFKRLQEKRKLLARVEREDWGSDEGRRE